MRPGDLLHQLDRKLLPPLICRVTRLGQGPSRLRSLTWTALVCSLAVLATAVWTVDRPVEDQTVGEVTRVGVVQGDSIPGYVAASRHELTTLLNAAETGPVKTYALIAFTGYLSPAQVIPVLTDVSVSEVYARVPLARTQTQIVRIPATRIPRDVLAGMQVVAGRKDREAGDYQARAATLTVGADPGLRGWYDSGARVARAEADAYRSGCACVYAAVVRATPAVLAELTTRSEVRAVDPAPEVHRLDRAVFSPPLPDQREVVRPPADAALPPAGAGAGAGAGATGSPPAPMPTSGSVSTPGNAGATSSPGTGQPAGPTADGTSIPVTPATAVPSGEDSADMVTVTP